jgi:hypothetical protein
MGVVATIVGVLVALLGLALPDGNGEVSNLAAMNLKTNLVILGSALFVGGVVMSSSARLEKALKARAVGEAMDRAIERRERDVSCV